MQLLGSASWRRCVSSPLLQFKRRSRLSLSSTSAMLRSSPSASQRSEVVVPATGLSARQFAAILDVTTPRILGIAKEIEEGEVTPDHILGSDVIELVAEELGRNVVRQSFEWDRSATSKEKSREQTIIERIPVIAVMGHVDHGKTTLLEALRGVGGLVEREIGGITQKIGAFQVDVGGNKMTILDTPGHEAFMSMRAHGAIATDLIVLVVAADDGVMPQTVETVKIAKMKKVPFVVAINKCDKEGADPERVRAQLSTLTNIQTEQLGGDVQCVEISAKARTGLDSLIDALSLQSELLDLKAQLNTPAAAVVIESRSDKRLGTIATVIVRQGILKSGDRFFFTSIHSVDTTLHGTVRSLTNANGTKVAEVRPGEAAALVGFCAVPEPGARLYVVSTEKEARTNASAVALRNVKAAETMALANLKIAKNKHEERRPGEVSSGVKDHSGPSSSLLPPTLNVVVKGDTVGSIEAVIRVLTRLSESSFPIRIIHSGVGDVTESDLSFAGMTNRIKGVRDMGTVVAFGVRKSSKVATLARRSNVKVHYHRLIYKLEDDFRDMKERTLRARQEIKRVVGVADVVRGFNDGAIAGCRVKDGCLSVRDRARVLRLPTARSTTERVEIFEGVVESIRKFSDSVRKAEKGSECGLSLQGWNDFRSGDVVEAINVVPGDPGAFVQ